MRFVVVSHGQASDPFWSVVKNGVDQAAADLGVTVEYRAPGTLRHGADGADHRCRRGLAAGRPRGLDPRRRRARRFDPERGRLGHPGGLDELGLRRARGAGRRRPRRPDRVRGRPRRRQADEGGGRHQGDLRQPGGRQRRARSALRGLHRRPRGRLGRGRRGQHGPDRDRQRGQGVSHRQSRHRRRAHARAVRRRADHGGARGGRDAGQGQVRHLRSVARRARGDRRRAG